MNIRLLFLFLLLPFISIAQDCIDEQSINPDCICGQIYQPVCGCDGVLYSNPCEATQCSGVTSYTSALDENGNIIDCSTLVTENSICDSILVEFSFLGVNNEDDYAYIEIDMSTLFTSEYFFGYAGFVFVDDEGEIIASEIEETAGNVYGFSGQYSDTRTLVFYYDINFSAEGSLQLMEGLFSGNPQLACSFPFSYSIEGDIDLSGQWYASEFNDYIEITEDTFSIYVFEEDCYELESFAYEANDSLVYLSDDGEIMSLNLSNLSVESFTLSSIESINLTTTTFDTSEWEECEDDTIECMISNVFAEAGECDSLGMIMIDIEFEVDASNSFGFNISGNGIDYGFFEYGQVSYTFGPVAADGETEYEFVISDGNNPDCNDFTNLGPINCDGSTSIVNLSQRPVELLFIKNLLGETVHQVIKNRPYIYLYSDGSFEKRIIFVE